MSIVELTAPLLRSRMTEEPVLVQERRWVLICVSQLS